MGGVRIATNRPKEFQGHRIMPCAGPEANRKHSFVTAQHLNVLRLGEPTVLLCADFVFGAGALEALTRLAGTYKLVVVPAIRLHMEAMQSCLGSAAQPLENRELCRLALQNIHPNAKVLFGGTARCPYQSYRWEGKDLKAQCYHMHPIIMTGLPGSGTVDNGVENFKPEETYVVQDSDELAVFELSPKRYDWGSKGDGASKEDTAAWVQAKTNSMHRWFFEQECTIHG